MASKLYGVRVEGRERTRGAAVMSLACVKCRLAIRQRFSLGTFFPLLSEQAWSLGGFFGSNVRTDHRSADVRRALRHPAHWLVRKRPTRRHRLGRYRVSLGCTFLQV